MQQTYDMVCTVHATGSDAAAQRQDSMSEDYATGKVNFYLQYFFPPSSVGETGRTGGMPGRREVGHGMLAQRALAPIVPDEVSLILDALSSALGINLLKQEHLP